MTGYQRRNHLRLMLLGLCLTLLVSALSMTDGLAPLERRLSDQRAAWCQFHVTPHTEALIHLDIDDSALDDIHRWPWPRGVWAQVVDELRYAGSRTVAFDVLFTEPQLQDSRLTETADLTLSDQDIQSSDTDDARFARAIKAHGSVILPATFSYISPTPAFLSAIEQMIHNPQLMNSFEFYNQAARSDPAKSSIVDAVLPNLKRDDYLQARKRAMFELLVQMIKARPVADGPLTLDDARQHFFKDLDPALTNNPQLRLLKQQFEKAVAYLEIVPGPNWLENPLHWAPRAGDVTPPTPELARWAAASGFVDVVPDPDGVVRRVPAMIKHDEDSFSQLGIALAQQYWRDQSAPAVFTDKGLEFKLSDKTVVVPHESQGRLLIPWSGTVGDWQSIVGPSQHLAVGYVWEAARLAQSLDTNRRSADQAVYDLYNLALDPSKAKELQSANLDFEDDAARAERIKTVLSELATLNYPQALTEIPVTDLDVNERNILAAIAALRVIPEQNEKLAQELISRRSDLQRRLNDKAVLVGFTASGLGDIITTPLHTRCPGVIAHGAIFNAIMTNSFWSQATWKAEIPTIVLMGLAGSIMAIMLAPALSTLAMLLLIAIYALVNGLFIFDRLDVQLSLAGPMLATSISWAGCILVGFILERRERDRITRRFQNYVDPTLVNYVLENPDKARLEGEARTMSVVFTDLEGFTKLSSAIHERVVPVINRYLEQMIPPIHEHNGYVNKFLGDGIMFFFSAPRQNPAHALDAVRAIMQMQKLMAPFNEHLQAEGLSPLNMRVGMTTGRMIVGDAGSRHRSDYTVMGDQVNFAARLESANKATGTSILINDAAAELVQDHYLLRPVGRLQVVGRTEAVMCFEPLCLLSQAGDGQRKLVEMTHQLIQAYTEQRWEDSLAAAKALEEVDALSHKLVGLYRLNIKLFQENPVENFDGRIELTSK